MAFVEVTKKDHIAVVTMNRPEALNALNKAVFTDLEVALDDVERDDEVYVVIITGAGRAFIAGADIGEMAPMNVAEGLAFSELGNRILMRVDMMEKPTIAAVNGFALGGGCEMALACDIRIASEKAKFGQPEVGLGIIPGFGGTQRHGPDHRHRPRHGADLHRRHHRRPARPGDRHGQPRGPR